MKKWLFVSILAIIMLLTYSFAFATTAESTTSVKWVLDQYVDEFGRQTGDKIVHNEELIFGNFSNTVIQNASLGVFVVADNTDVYLILYEYGNQMVTNGMSQTNKLYDVSVLDAKNKKYTLKGAIAPSDFRLYFDNNDIIINAIKSGSISIAITSTLSQANRYNFTIENTTNFETLYSQVK